MIKLLLETGMVDLQQSHLSRITHSDQSNLTKLLSMIGYACTTKSQGQDAT